MPKPLPPHLHRETSRHGQSFWTVRRGHGRRIRIAALFDSVEFWSQYEAALHALDQPRRREGPPPGTFAWALREYRKSNAWLTLADATRSQRTHVFVGIEKKLGDSLLRQWRTADIAAGRDARRPTMARQYLVALRGLFQWATENGHLKADPTAGLKVRMPASDGHAVWSEADVERYRARWPLGTRARVALELLLETGLRRGDVCRVGPSNVSGGVLRLATEKTGEHVSVAITPTLIEALDAGPVGTDTFIIGEQGRPLSKHTFGNWFKSWCDAAGLSNRSAHGLRKASATLDAHAGYTEAELDAKYGWTGRKMASLYTKSANRERLSLSAAERTAASRTTPIKAPVP
jgi:integrase